MAPLKEDFDSSDLLFLEKLQTADPLILSFKSFHSILDTTKERRFPSPSLGFEPISSSTI